MSVSIDILENIEVFENISRSALEKIAENAYIYELKKNECLYGDGEVLNNVYFVLSGKVTLSKCNENGESRIIFIVGEGSMINQPIMRKNTSAVECRGFEKSRLLKIGFEEFDNIMSKDYILSRNCMIFMEKRIRSLYRQLKNSVTINIEKKLAAKLYRIGLEHGLKSDNDEFTYINIGITNTYLAKMLGCQRESVSRSMKILSEKGVVKNEGRKIYVNMDKARKLFKS